MNAIIQNKIFWNIKKLLSCFKIILKISLNQEKNLFKIRKIFKNRNKIIKK